MIFSKLLALSAASVGVYGACLSSWTDNGGSCVPPTSMTDTISCDEVSFEMSISPSDVFDEYTYIPPTVLSGLTVEIQDSNDTWHTFVTFGKSFTTHFQINSLRMTHDSWTMSLGGQ